jgi:hypothetical protein
MTVLNDLCKHPSPSARLVTSSFSSGALEIGDYHTRLDLGVVASQNSNVIRASLFVYHLRPPTRQLLGETAANMTAQTPDGAIVTSRKMSSRASSKVASKLPSAQEVQER